MASPTPLVAPVMRNVGKPSKPADSSVTGSYDSGLLDHDHRAAYWHDRTMQHAGRDAEGLIRLEYNGVPALQLDVELTLQEVEELVLLIVLVPVILPLHHSKADQDIAHPDQSLVVPRLRDGVDEVLNIDRLEGLEERLVMDRVAGQVSGGGLIDGLSHRSFLTWGFFLTPIGAKVSLIRVTRRRT